MKSSSGSTTHMMNPPSDDEWEYIYHPTEIETITWTIDLSAAPSGPSLATSNTTGSQEQTEADAQVNGDNDQPATALISGIPKAKATVQFLDLPSESPYISYQGQVFTGTWGETIGSDLIFASTNDILHDVEPVMKSKDGKWCLLAISRTTLVAKPIELVKRSRLETQSAGDQSDAATVAAQIGTEAAQSAKEKSRKPFTVLLPGDADPKQKRQAAFLEQLMAVKLARGEKDIVYIGKSMKYIDADGKTKKAPGIKKRDLDMMNGVINPEASTGPGKRKRGRGPIAADQEDDDYVEEGEEENADDIAIDPELTAGGTGIGQGENYGGQEVDEDDGEQEDDVDEAEE